MSRCSSSDSDRDPALSPVRPRSRSRSPPLIRPGEGKGQSDSKGKGQSIPKGYSKGMTSREIHRMAFMRRATAANGVNNSKGKGHSKGSEENDYGDGKGGKSSTSKGECGKGGSKDCNGSKGKGRLRPPPVPVGFEEEDGSPGSTGSKGKGKMMTQMLTQIRDSLDGILRLLSDS